MRAPRALAWFSLMVTLSAPLQSAPRGLPQALTGRAWVIFVDDLHPNLNDAAWQKYWTTTRNSLQVIAEQTGGFVIQENLEDGLKRIVE
jgi:hypothetical protein